MGFDLAVHANRQTWGQDMRADLAATQRVVTDPDALGKVGHVAKKIAESAFLVLGKVPDAANAILKDFGGAITIAELVEPIKRLAQLVPAARQTPVQWAECGALAGTMIHRSMSFLVYLHKIGVPFLEGFASTVGAYAIAPLAFLSNAFDMTQHSINLSRLPEERAACVAAHELATIREEVRTKALAGAALTPADQANYVAAVDTLQNRTFQWIQKVGNRDARIIEIARMIRLQKNLNGEPNAKCAFEVDPVAAAPIDAQAQWKNFAAAAPNAFVVGTADHRYAERITAHIDGPSGLMGPSEDVKRWNGEVQICEIKQNKGIWGIVAAITKMAIIAMTMTGFLFSVAALATTTPLMIACAFVVAAIALAKVIYDKKYDEKTLLEIAPRFPMTPALHAAVTPQLLQAF